MVLDILNPFDDSAATSGSDVIGSQVDPDVGHSLSIQTLDAVLRETNHSKIMRSLNFYNLLFPTYGCRQYRTGRYQAPTGLITHSIIISKHNTGRDTFAPLR